ncbi:hypothetical protein ACZ90_03195 [Streptomyces albus subsp. albus]|nr:hypothetical protein ACZ90_03195 [Streptomyces albus subsp. albus]
MPMRRILSAGSAVFLAGAVAVAGVGGCDSSGEGKPRKTGTTVTSTRTVTTTPEPTPTSTPTRPPPPPHTPTSTAPTDAAATVEAYYDAINARDYRRAWDLGGKTVSGGSYASFVAGFAHTAQDTVHIVAVSGDVVTITLDAVQRDGSVKSFAGNYTVRAGAIVAADIQELPGRSGLPPGPPPGPDLDCPDIGHPVWVDDNDPHHLDADGDGIGCEES